MTTVTTTTRRNISNVVAGVLVLVIASLALAGTTIEIRMKDGSRWRGNVADRVKLTVLEQGIGVALEGTIVEAGDHHLIVEVPIGGQLRRKTIFKGDIQAIASLDKPVGKPAEAAIAAKSAADAAKPDAAASPNQPGVFVLPLEGMVGLYLRHEEMQAIAEEADKWGDGQIIVLLIDSPGGSVVETEKIHDVLMEVKKRHRLVAWIKEAISAACATALHCDEIYFMTEGTAGAMTAYSGQTALQGEMLEEWLRRAGEWAEAGGRSRYIAEAMIDEKKIVSYTKDPVTGEVTWYSDKSGKVILSDEKDNLVFSSSQAVDSGFADGVADTEQQLAKLLDLPRWNEKSTYGRKIAKSWKDTVDKAQEELPMIRARMAYDGTGTNDQEVILGRRIKNLEEVIRWIDRAPNVAQMGGIPPKEDIERQIKQLRKDLADLKKQRKP